MEKEINQNREHIDTYYIDKNTGRVVVPPFNGTERLEQRVRIRGGNPLDAVLNFIFKIFDPIIKPMRGIVDAILMLIKAIVYIILLFIWFIRVSVWFLVDVIPTIPSDMWSLAKILTSSLFNFVIEFVKLVIKKIVNKGGVLTVSAISQGWDNVPDSGTQEPEEPGFYQEYVSCKGKKCYVTSEGTIPGTIVMATILFPPLGVFMEYGATGWLQILITFILTLLLYIPGLIYALILLYC